MGKVWNAKKQPVQMFDEIGVEKVNNWIEVWPTGLDQIEDSHGRRPFNLTDEYYDFENDRYLKCNIGKGRTCPYPFFVGIVEGDFDMSCWADMLNHNYPKWSAEGRSHKKVCSQG